ncbi:AraC family transcriptional regulator [Streptomyces sp. NPDC059578]|uniref:AraC family transcriptional regulator n=1 Tax=unclassified Streptomyces TaxID=2593676 RepID=UPI003651D20A
MDALANLLYETRARGAVFGRSILDPPWSLRFVGGSPLTLMTMLSGTAWVRVDGAEPVRVEPGDLVIVTGSAPHTVSDAPTTPAGIDVHGSERCVTAEGVDVTEDIRLDLRACGERYEGSAMLLTGLYQGGGEVSGRLLEALPAVLRVPGAEQHHPMLELVRAEVERADPGQQVVVDRMLDLLLVYTLRAWFARPEARAPGWYRALGDPVVGGALRLMHDDPARPWTVRMLADEVGVSRSGLGHRFTLLVGEPPMAYLAGWRVSLASDLLRATDDTVASVARQVGYADAFALSAAFKRIRGTRPSDHRRTGAADARAALG